jgi:hypothetical protein
MKRISMPGILSEEASEWAEAEVEQVGEWVVKTVSAGDND